MGELKEGLYDQLVTRQVRDSLDRQAKPGLESLIEALDDTDYPDYLARHLARQIKAALRAVPTEDRNRRQIEIANALVDFISSPADAVEPDLVNAPGQVLRAIYRGPNAPKPPSTPLSITSLLM